MTNSRGFHLPFCNRTLTHCLLVAIIQCVKPLLIGAAEDLVQQLRHYTSPEEGAKWRIDGLDYTVLAIYPTQYTSVTVPLFGALSSGRQKN